MTPNERDYEVWDKINLYTKELLSCVVGEIVYELSRTQEPAKTMLAKERQYAAIAPSSSPRSRTRLRGYGRD